MLGVAVVLPHIVSSGANISRSAGICKMFKYYVKVSVMGKELAECGKVLLFLNSGSLLFITVEILEIHLSKGCSENCSTDYLT